MQIDWLRAFVAVAETGSVVRAAHAMGRPQSRVSSYIAALEGDLGVVLVDRGRRPLKLTIAGDLFLGHARQALRAIDTARRDIEHLSGRRYGTVRLACIPSVAAAFAPLLIERFTRREPNISVQVLEIASSAVATPLLERAADLAIMPLAYVQQKPEFLFEELWTEPLRAVVSAAHPLASRSSLTPAEIASELIVTAGSAEGGQGLSPEVAAIFADLGSLPALTRRVASPHTLIALVRRGVAVGITSPLALELTGTEGVRVLDIDSDVQRQIVLAWRRGEPLPSHVEALREYISRADAPTPRAADIADPSAGPDS